jgi:hypothetical protein
MGALFISHSTQDDDYVRRLRQALEVQKQRGRDNFPVIPLSE